MTITDLITTLRQYAADRSASPKYTDADLMRIIARAIMYLPQLQSPRDRAYIRSRDHVPVFFDDSSAFTNLTNVTIDGQLRLTNTALPGSVDRVIAASELRADFVDLLFVYLETKETSGTGSVTIDLSLDGGQSFLVGGGYESSLAKATYLNVSTYAKFGLTIRLQISAGTRKVDAAQCYLLFLKDSYLLDYAASLEWAAMAIIDGDLLHEAQTKGYDLTVINSLAMSRESNLRRATGRTASGEPLEKPQSQDPGAGLKTSQLGGSGRDSDRVPIECTSYGRSVRRVFGA